MKRWIPDEDLMLRPAPRQRDLRGREEIEQHAARLRKRLDDMAFKRRRIQAVEIFNAPYGKAGPPLVGDPYKRVVQCFITPYEFWKP